MFFSFSLLLSIPDDTSFPLDYGVLWSVVHVVFFTLRVGSS